MYLYTKGTFPWRVHGGCFRQVLKQYNQMYSTTLASQTPIRLQHVSKKYMSCAMSV